MATYDFTQLDIEKQPVVGAADVQWNRADSATFDGTHVMASADVGKILGSKRASTVFIVVEGGTQTEAYPSILFVRDGASIWSLEYQDSEGRLKFQQLPSGGSIYLTTEASGFGKRVVCIRNNGHDGTTDSGADAFIDNLAGKVTDTAFNSRASGDVDLDNAVAYFGDNATPNNPFVGSFPCAPIIFDRALSDSEIETAFDSLWQTYGVGCWEYDGSTSGTVVSADTDMQLSDAPWTIAFKFKLNSTADANAYLFSIDPVSANPSMRCVVRPDNDGTYPGQIQVRLEDDAEDNISLYSGTSYTDDTDWHSVVIVRSAVGDYALFIDDPISTKDSVPVGTVDALTFTGTLIFGYNRSSSERLDGCIRDFAIMNAVAWSQAQRTAYMAGEYAADQDDAPNVNLVMLPDYATNNPTYITQGFTPAGLEIANTAVTGTRQA